MASLASRLPEIEDVFYEAMWYYYMDEKGFMFERLSYVADMVEVYSQGKELVCGISQGEK